MKPKPPDWREFVQKKAYQATLKEAKLRWGNGEPTFNYRWEHVQTVVRLAVRLAELTGADHETVEAGAWLHDIKKQGKDDNHGPDGAQEARRILAKTDFPPAKIEAVADTILKHVGLFTEAPLQPLEAAVLWDADKLSKLGATGALHFSGYRIAMGQETTENLIERMLAQSWQSKSVQCLHTEPARAAGRARLQAYRAFWERLAQEIQGDDLF